MSGSRSFWMEWCRLCAKVKTDEQDEFVPIEQETYLCDVVQRLCETTIVNGDFPDTLCASCVDYVRGLADFSDRCQMVNKMYMDLVFMSDEMVSGESINALRRQYELEDMDDSEYYMIVHKESDDLVEESKSEYEEISIEVSGSSTVTEWNESKEIIKEEFDVVSDLDISLEDGNVNFIEIDIDSHENDNTDQHDDAIQTTSTDLEQPEKSQRKSKDVQLGLKCFECLASFTGVRDYKNHMRTVHLMMSYPFRCTKCSKGFQTLKQFQRHTSCENPIELRKQTSASPQNPNILNPVAYACNFCEQQFSQSDELQAHIKAMHSAERPFVCEECGKCCGTKGALKEHQIIHSDERPFKCAHCPKSFKNLPRLKTHEDIHKNTNYICPHCGIQLNTKITLKMHLVVHSDVKKFKCQYCGNEYKRSKALKNHLILHTGIRPYTCPFCDKTFANGSNCRSHKKKAHPVELAALEAAGVVARATNLPKLANLRSSTMDQLVAAETTTTTTHAPSSFSA